MTHHSADESPKLDILAKQLRSLINGAPAEREKARQWIKVLSKELETPPPGDIPDAYRQVKLSRHPKRPTSLDLIPLVFDSFIELHGDRCFGDDPAMVAGLAFLDGMAVTLIAHQKGRNLEENLTRNFGMSHPEGYRKAGRLMEAAGRFGRPVITLIDTPGAYPGIGAEERGQSIAIARNLYTMSMLKTPIVSVVTGEGGSGGALGIGVADRIFMFRNSVYSVISPEGCAAILWKDAAKAKQAAHALKLTAPDLKALGIIDGIIPEPDGGNHEDVPAAAALLRETLLAALPPLLALTPRELVAKRTRKYRRIGLPDGAQVPSG